MVGELVAGTMVTPNVRLVRLLGQGGMGSVWVADHLSLHTQVAVKFISAELVRSEPTIIARFNREAALCAQIKSPHVVQIFDHGVMADGTPYLVMELLDGESLATRLERGPLGLTEARVVIGQVAKALWRAHKLDIVHRDIKPDNVFLLSSEEELVCKVLDFGIAKQSGMPQYGAVTQTGMMVGTPEFMSPEQVLSAKNVDHRADLWALGVVAYHALTGAVPFSGETLGSLCVAIAAGTFVPVTARRPDLPPALDAWFAQALAIQPEARFASARDMAAALEAAVEGRPVFGDDSSGSLPVRATQTSSAGPTVAASSALQSGPHLVATSPTFAGAAAPIAPPRRRGALALGGVLALAGGMGLYFALASGRSGPAAAEGGAGARTDSVTTEQAATVTAGAPPPSTTAAASSATTAATASSATAAPSSAPPATASQSAAQATATGARAGGTAPPPPTKPPPKSPGKDRGF